MLAAPPTLLDANTPGVALGVPAVSKPPPPGLLRMALDATEAMVRFVGSGFKTAPEATYRERLQARSICDHHTRLAAASAAASPASRRSSCTKTARPGGGRDETTSPQPTISLVSCVD